METRSTAVDRIAGFDWLRCIAILAVVAIHTSDIALKKGGYFPLLTFEGMAWYLFNGLARFCVPVFLLMTAFLAERRWLLSGKEPDTYWKRYTLPLVGANLFYLMLFLAQNRLLHKSIEWKPLFLALITGQVYYHTWYLGVVLLYILTHRILRQLSTGPVMAVVLVVAIAAFAVPQWHTLRGDSPVLRLGFSFVMGIPYYLLGIMMAKQETRWRDRGGHWGWVLLVAGTVALGTYAVMARDLTFFNIGVLMTSVGLFVLALQDKRSMPGGVQRSAALSLGIYLWHPLFLDILRIAEGRYYREHISAIVTLMIVMIEMVIALVGSYIVSALLSRHKPLAFMAK